MTKPLSQTERPRPTTEFKERLSIPIAYPGCEASPETIDKLLALRLIDMYRHEQNPRYKAALKIVLENFLPLTAFDALEDTA